MALKTGYYWVKTVPGFGAHNKSEWVIAYYDAERDTERLDFRAWTFPGAEEFYRYSGSISEIGAYLRESPEPVTPPPAVNQPPTMPEFWAAIKITYTAETLKFSEWFNRYKSNAWFKLFPKDCDCIAARSYQDFPPAVQMGIFMEYLWEVAPPAPEPGFTFIHSVQNGIREFFHELATENESDE